MSRHQCKNPTCTAPAGPKSFCSRRCQTTMRNTGRPGHGQLPDIWVGMDTERALRQRAETLGLTVSDLIINLLEAEVAPIVGWDRMSLMGAAQ